MTQLERLRIRITETDISDIELEDILESAKAVILSRRYPFGEQPQILKIGIKTYKSALPLK